MFSLQQTETPQGAHTHTHTHTHTLITPPFAFWYPSVLLAEGKYVTYEILWMKFNRKTTCTFKVSRSKECKKLYKVPSAVSQHSKLTDILITGSFRDPKLLNYFFFWCWKTGEKCNHTQSDLTKRKREDIWVWETADWEEGQKHSWGSECGFLKGKVCMASCVFLITWRNLLLSVFLLKLSSNLVQRNLQLFHRR